MSEQPASLPNGFRDSTGEALLRPDPSPLPEEWRVVRLGEVAQIEMGQSPPSITYNSEGIGLPFFQGKADFGDIYPTTRKWCSSPNKIAEKDDILLSVRAPIGDVNIATQRCCIGRGLTAIRAGAKSDSKYLFYHLLFSQELLESKGTGTTFKQINKETVTHFLIPLPPLAEQRAIAHVLTSIQRAIEATEQVIAAARELKKALMRHLFTYGPVPPAEAESVPLQETEIGPLPVHWRVVRLGEISEVKYGKANPNDSGSIPIVGSGGIFANTSTPLVTHPTLVIGRKGTAGKVWLFLSPCYPSDTTFYLHWKKEIDVSFVFYFLNLRPLSGEHAKTTLPSLQKPYLENTSVPLPPLPEQRAIAEMLGAVDEKIQAEERRKAALQSLFRSMLHYLMTGKVRVAGLVTPPTQPEE